MKLPIKNLGQYGVVVEVPDEDLPLNAWTEAYNVDFRDGIVRKSNGYQRQFGVTGGGGPPYSGLFQVRPYWLFPYFDPQTTTQYWIIAGISNSGNPKIEAFDGSGVIDVTGTDITQNPVYWNGGNMKGLPVVNTGAEEPQMWARDPVTGNLKSTFEALTNWPSGYTANVVRPYKDFIIAIGIDDGVATSTKNVWRVMWSDAMEPYTPPAWTPTTGNRAGDVTLGEGRGALVDCLPLRGHNLIYATDRVWAMRFIGGNQVFAFDPIIDQFGLLTQRCVKRFKAGMHFVVTFNDIIIHDGNTAESICDSRVRDFIFQDMDPANYVNAFVVSHYRESEMWFCYPTNGETLPNKIAKWNTKTGVWSFTQYDINFAHIGWGVFDSQIGVAVDWDSDSQAWDLDSEPWDTYNPAALKLIMAEPGATVNQSNIHEADVTNQNNGSNMTAKLEKTGISVDSEDGILFCDEVLINAEDGPFEVSIGGSDTPDGVYTWDAYTTFDPSTDYKRDCRVAKRYLGFRIQSTGNVGWKMTKYTPIIEQDGDR